MLLVLRFLWRSFVSPLVEPTRWNWGEVGFPECPIRDTDFLCLLDSRPLYWVVTKDTVIYVTVFDPNVLQGFRNFCRRAGRCIIFIREVSVQSTRSDESQAYLHLARTPRIR